MSVLIYCRSHDKDFKTCDLEYGDGSDSIDWLRRSQFIYWLSALVMVKLWLSKQAPSSGREQSHMVADNALFQEHQFGNRTKVF